MKSIYFKMLLGTVLHLHSKWPTRQSVFWKFSEIFRSASRMTESTFFCCFVLYYRNSLSHSICLQILCGKAISMEKNVQSFLASMLNLARIPISHCISLTENNLYCVMNCSKINCITIYRAKCLDIVAANTKNEADQNYYGFPWAIIEWSENFWKSQNAYTFILVIQKMFFLSIFTFFYKESSC